MEVTQKIDLKIQNRNEIHDTDSINQIQIELTVKKDLFQLDKYDILVVTVILVICALILLLCTSIMKLNVLLFAYVFVIGYGLSLCCSILLNAKSITIKKRYLIITISYAIFLILGFICLSLIKKLEIFVSIIVLFSSYWVMIIIFQFEKGSGMSTKQSLKYLYSIKALITPIFIHFANIATDLETQDITFSLCDYSYSLL
eukprot:204195_1